MNYMSDKEKIFTNADAIRQLNNDDLEFLLCNNKCKECDLKDLCGDKYPNGFEDWLKAEYSGNIFEELFLKNMILSVSKNQGYPSHFFPSKTELWLLRVISQYEKCIDNIRQYKDEKTEKKKLRENKVIIIGDLTYETLSKVFDNNILYDTNRIIIKQKVFSNEDVERALAEHTKYISDAYDLHKQCASNRNSLEDRGKVIDLLSNMLSYDLSDSSEMGTAIQETLLFRQMQLYGMRKFVYGSANRIRKRYFNPEAPIVIETLEV